MTAFFEIILKIFHAIELHFAKQKAEEYKDEKKDIDEDPVDYANNKYGRMPNDGEQKDLSGDNADESNIQGK